MSLPRILTLLLVIATTQCSCSYRVTWEPGPQSEPPAPEKDNKDADSNGTIAQDEAEIDLPDGVEYVADLRHGIIIPCGGAKQTAENPFGLRDGQALGPFYARKFYKKHYARAERLGFKRVIWHMLAGWDQRYDMIGAAAVLDAMGDRKEVWIEETKAFLERNPDVSIGVYLSARVPQTHDSVNPADIFPAETYDHSNPEHRERMVEKIIKPLVDVGVKEIWFDHSSPKELRKGILDMSAYLRKEYGLHCVMEAIPLNSDRTLHVDTLKKMPSCALNRFHVTRDPDGKWIVPEGIEIIVMLSGHPIDKYPNRSVPTIEDMKKYIKRGMVLFSMNSKYDALLIEAVRLSN